MLEETPTQMFFCVYCEIFKNSFFIEHVWWLLLNALMENTNVMIFDHFNKFVNVFLSISQQQKYYKRDFPLEVISVS